MRPVRPENLRSTERVAERFPTLSERSIARLLSYGVPSANSEHCSSSSSSSSSSGSEDEDVDENAGEDPIRRRRSRGQRRRLPECRGRPDALDSQSERAERLVRRATEWLDDFMAEDGSDPSPKPATRLLRPARQLGDTDSGLDNQAKQQLSVSERAQPWREYSTETGLLYYNNSMTGDSSWDMPEELRRLRDRERRLDEAMFSGVGAPAEQKKPAQIDHCARVPRDVYGILRDRRLWRRGRRGAVVDATLASDGCGDAVDNINSNSSGSGNQQTAELDPQEARTTEVLFNMSDLAKEEQQSRMAKTRWKRARERVRTFNSVDKAELFVSQMQAAVDMLEMPTTLSARLRATQEKNLSAAETDALAGTATKSRAEMAASGDGSSGQLEEASSDDSVGAAVAASDEEAQMDSGTPPDQTQEATTRDAANGSETVPLDPTDPTISDTQQATAAAQRALPPVHTTAEGTDVDSGSSRSSSGTCSSMPPSVHDGGLGQRLIELREGDSDSLLSVSWDSASSTAAANATAAARAAEVPAQNRRRDGSAQADSSSRAKSSRCLSRHKAQRVRRARSTPIAGGAAGTWGYYMAEESQESQEAERRRFMRASLARAGKHPLQTSWPAPTATPDKAVAVAATPVSSSQQGTVRISNGAMPCRPIPPTRKLLAARRRLLDLRSSTVPPLVWAGQTQAAG
eukprot:COSAG06_NODE_209_length_20178_cov_4.309478_5_plen_689_part_00